MSKPLWYGLSNLAVEMKLKNLLYYPLPKTNIRLFIE